MTHHKFILRFLVLNFESYELFCSSRIGNVTSRLLKDRQTDQQTDMRDHRYVTLPKHLQNIFIIRTLNHGEVREMALQFSYTLQGWNFFFRKKLTNMRFNQCLIVNNYVMEKK